MSRHARTCTHPACRQGGFSLIELLVAVAVFAVASALAYAGLAAIVDTRQRLAREQETFHAIQRSVSLLARDLAAAVVRPIRAADGRRMPTMVGDAGRIEFTRSGYLGPPAGARSTLERVAWFAARRELVRARYTVLDRAPTSVPLLRTVNSELEQFTLRYLDHDGRWQLRWPPPQGADPAPLPRAVEFRLRFASTGEIRRLVELPASVPFAKAEANAP